MTEERIVELIPAHVWVCDDCGRDNFCRGVVWEPDRNSAEDVAFAKEVAGVDEWEDLPEGFLMQAPEVVTCEHCGSTFRTVEPDGFKDV